MSLERVRERRGGRAEINRLALLLRSLSSPHTPHSGREHSMYQECSGFPLRVLSAPVDPAARSALSLTAGRTNRP